MLKNRMRSKIRHFMRSQTGATAIEYGLIASLVIVAIVGAVAALGQGLQDNLYNKIASAFS